MTQAVAPITAIRIRNILFATDFSEISSYAIPYVACIARHFGATIFPTYVIPGEPRYEIPMDHIAEELTASKREAEMTIAKVAAHPLLRDLPQHVVVERGDVWSEIEEVIKDYDVDMIIIGTHGRGGFGKIVFGSVAEQIFRQAPCPVMVVGPYASGHRVVDGAFQRILFATDCSKESLDLLPFAVDLANAFGAFLKVVTVVQESKEAMLRYVPDVVEEKQRLLEGAISRLRLVHEPEVVVEVGPVVDAILKVADLNNVDLTIMGAHTTSSPAAMSHIPSSITHFVASHAHCPVLAVRTGNHGLPVQWQREMEGSPL